MTMQRFFFVCTLFLSATFAVAHDLTIHIIDVGQGDAILVQSPEGKSMLIDGGTRDKRAENYLAALDIPALDIVVATHPHLDHIGGLPNIVKQYDVKHVVMPSVTSVSTAIYRQLLDTIDSKGIPITEGRAGLVLDFGQDITLECLAPSRAAYKDLNDYSVVLKLTYGDISFMLPGDATTISEGDMLEVYRDRLKSTVLKVGHHGSAGSSSEEFVQEVNPLIVIFCAGEGNTYGHPTPVILNRLSSAYQYRTDKQGTVIFTTDGKQVSAYSPPVSGKYHGLTAYHVPEGFLETTQYIVSPLSTATALTPASPKGYYTSKSVIKCRRTGKLTIIKCPSKHRVLFLAK
jgi:beta-lactamase superfamily II metal-dependent hydrolase